MGGSLLLCLLFWCLLHVLRVRFFCVSECLNLHCQANDVKNWVRYKDPPTNYYYYASKSSRKNQDCPSKEWKHGYIICDFENSFYDCEKDAKCSFAYHIYGTTDARESQNHK